KRLLVGGFEKIFTICKNFRNEDADTTHNPEFTMLECYQAYVDYNQMMEYMEQVYERTCLALNGTTKVKHKYKGEEVVLDFKAPWPRLSMLDALRKYAQLDLCYSSKEEVLDLVSQHDIDFAGEFSWGLGVQLLFEHLVEDKLVQPVHIIDHSRESTPLCKIHRKDSRLIERFESFCLGAELCNAYSELNDPLLQKKLLEEQARQLHGGAEEAHPMDEDFVNALEYGLPPTGGLGFGIDRMAICLTGVESIRDVILFPTMKPVVEEEKKEEKK
ncbi:lysine--tRNA ligase, partial [Candidatus Woesearchaeota archaeon]|nr:lysine--tRNA ligase [Candidatus Woesearchaeota archaeon]